MAWGLKITSLLSHHMEVGRDGRVPDLLSRPESLTAKANAVVRCHIWRKGFYCVHAKLRRHKRDKS